MSKSTGRRQGFKTHFQRSQYIPAERVCQKRREVEAAKKSEQEVEGAKWKPNQVLTFVLCLCQMSPEGSTVFKILHQT